MKKTGIILAIALLTSVSVFAQREYSTFSARISTFGRSFDRPSIELEFTKAYGVPAYQVRDYYEGVDNNWGDLSLAFEFAAKHGIHFCYLETTANLWQAVKLYEKLGFQHLSAPKGKVCLSSLC